MLRYFGPSCNLEYYILLSKAMFIPPIGARDQVASGTIGTKLSMVGITVLRRCAFFQKTKPKPYHEPLTLTLTGNLNQTKINLIDSGVIVSIK